MDDRTRRRRMGCSITAAIVLSAVMILYLAWYVPEQRKGRIKACMENQLHFSRAIAMYAQDHGEQYPGKDWLTDIYDYGGNFAKWYRCPEARVGANEFPLCYAYNASLVQPDGTGVKTTHILAPAKTGLTIDAAPVSYRQPAYLLGGTVITREHIRATVEIAPRHHHRAVAAFCDGHAEAIHYTHTDAGNAAHRLNQAFFGAGDLGYVVEH